MSHFQADVRGVRMCVCMLGGRVDVCSRECPTHGPATQGWEELHLGISCLEVGECTKPGCNAPSRIAVGTVDVIACIDIALHCVSENVG